jgi:hypothetical protein
MLVPAGRTGTLVLVTPKSGALDAIEGFGAKEGYAGGHSDGPTSADEGAGFVFVTDRTTRALCVVDPRTRAIVARVELRAEPDYVRFVAATREIWVTEPDAEAIEIFRLPADGDPVPTRVASLSVPGGPETLEIDAQRSRANPPIYRGALAVIDVATRRIVARWNTSCRSSRGLVLDEARGLAFVGCAEGRLVVLDLEADGRLLGGIDVGGSIDLFAYDPARRHLYVPSGQDATLTVVGVSRRADLSVLGRLPAAPGTQSVGTDGQGRIFLADPSRGRLLVLRDPFPAGGR